MGGAEAVEPPKIGAEEKGEDEGATAWLLVPPKPDEPKAGFACWLIPEEPNAGAGACPPKGEGSGAGAGVGVTPNVEAPPKVVLLDILFGAPKEDDPNEGLLLVVLPNIP